MRGSVNENVENVKIEIASEVDTYLGACFNMLPHISCYINVRCLGNMAFYYDITTYLKYCFKVKVFVIKFRDTQCNVEAY